MISVSSAIEGIPLRPSSAARAPSFIWPPLRTFVASAIPSIMRRLMPGRSAPSRNRMRHRRIRTSLWPPTNPGPIVTVAVKTGLNGTVWWPGPSWPGPPPGPLRAAHGTQRGVLRQLVRAAASSGLNQTYGTPRTAFRVGPARRVARRDAWRITSAAQRRRRARKAARRAAFAASSGRQARSTMHSGIARARLPTEETGKPILGVPYV